MCIHLEQYEYVQSCVNNINVFVNSIKVKYGLKGETTLTIPKLLQMQQIFDSDI